MLSTDIAAYLGVLVAAAGGVLLLGAIRSSASRSYASASAVLGIGLALALWGLWRTGPLARDAGRTEPESRREAPAPRPATAPERTDRAAAAARGASDRPQPSSPDRLLYAISAGTTGRFPRPTQTEIYAMDPASGESRVVFSDADEDFLLLLPFRSGVPAIVIVAAGPYVFGHGNARSRMAGGYAPDPGSFYELSTDGSNRAREVCKVQGEQTAPRNVFVSSGGDKLGYINDIDAKWFVFIHDTETGTLLHRIALEPILLDGFVRNIGFMADGERVFFTGETGDMDVTSAESERRVGTYVMSLDGTDVSAVPDSIDGPTTRADFTSLPDTPPTMLGELPDGRYLFSELQFGRQATTAATFYFEVDPTTGQREKITPARTSSSDSGFNWSKPSADGAYLAFSEIDRERSEETVRTLDLRSGQTRTVLMQPIKPLSYPVLTVIGWARGNE